jgi:hypothetical protein
VTAKKVPDYAGLEAKLHAYLKKYEETFVDRYATGVNYEDLNKTQANRWPNLKLEKIKVNSMQFTQRYD